MTPSSSASSPCHTEFERLVHEHQAMLWRYLRFLGCDAAEASDLTQEPFVAVLSKPVHRFGEAGARAYLRRVAKNAFLKLSHRAAQRREVDLETAESAYEWYRGEDEGQSTIAALDTCLAELSPQARLALALRFAEKLPRPELAERLGIGPHGAKSLLQRSYARLRLCIERRLRDAQS